MEFKYINATFAVSSDVSFNSYADKYIKIYAFMCAFAKILFLQMRLEENGVFAKLAKQNQHMQELLQKYKSL